MQEHGGKLKIMKPAAIESINAERDRQNAKWGEQNHQVEWWLAILMEEVGELAQAIIETHFDNGEQERLKGGIQNIRQEAVQCAAVAVAMIECIDRALPKERNEKKHQIKTEIN